MPVAARVTDAKYTLEALLTPREVVLQRRVEPWPILGMHRDPAHPLRSGSNRHVRAAPIEHLHPGRQEQAIRGDIPVPIPFIRAIHGEGIVRLALAQCRLTAGHPFDLSYEQCQQHRTEKHHDEGPDGDANGLVAPGLQGHLHVARHLEPQGGCSSPVPPR
jgi:hypothetical protein